MTITRIILAIALATISSTAAAHAGLFPHPPIESEPMHALIHMLMVLPFGLAAYLVSRLLLKRSQPKFHAAKRNKR